MFYGVDFDSDLYGIRLIESRIREYISENVQRTCVYFGDTKEMEMEMEMIGKKVNKV